MITLGGTTTLSLSIPSTGERNWGTAIRTGCFQKIVDHDHQGAGGTGKKLSGYLALDLTAAILTNNTFLTARNAAASGNISILKVDGTDKVIIGASNVSTISGSTLAISGVSTIAGTSIAITNLASLAGTGVTLTGVASIAGTAIAISDVATITGTNIAVSNLSTLTGTAVTMSEVRELNASTTGILLTNNQAVAADTGIITALAANKAVIIDYKLVRNAISQTGTLILDKDSGSITNEYLGTSVGVTFSTAGNLIKYTSTNTGFAPTIYYTIRRL